jgi:hypothetical protein
MQWLYLSAQRGAMLQAAVLLWYRVLVILVVGHEVILLHNPTVVIEFYGWVIVYYDLAVWATGGWFCGAGAWFNCFEV